MWAGSASFRGCQDAETVKPRDLKGSSIVEVVVEAIQKAIRQRCDVIGDAKEHRHKYELVNR
jgi:hypothetical protein